MIERKGIDISKHQGKMSELFKIRKDYDFCILRAGLSWGENGKIQYRAKDSCFEAFYTDCIGNKIDCGCYFYTSAMTVDEAKTDAEYFLKLIDGKQFTYPVWLDLEHPSQANLDKDTLTDIAITFMDTVQQAGYYVGLYTSKSWLDYKLDTDRLASYDLWLAWWRDDRPEGINYGMWQKGVVKYDKNAGTGVPGFTCDVDLDYAYKDYPTIICNAGLNGFSKGSTPPNPDRHPERSGKVVEPEEPVEEKPVEHPENPVKGTPQEQPVEADEQLKNKIIDILKYALDKLED